VKASAAERIGSTLLSRTIRSARFVDAARFFSSIQG
jgi:hypothetical protein